MARSWSRMNLPIYYFDNPDQRKMLLATLEVAKCGPQLEKLAMSSYDLKNELAKQSTLAKNIILEHGYEWATNNMLQILVDHYSPKNSQFSNDLFGILLIIKNSKNHCGIFLSVKRVLDKTNPFSKKDLTQVLEVS